MVDFGVCEWIAGVSGGDHDLQQGICCEGTLCKQMEYVRWCFSRFRRCAARTQLVALSCRKRSRSRRRPFLRNGLPECPRIRQLQSRDASGMIEDSRCNEGSFINGLCFGVGCGGGERSTWTKNISTVKIALIDSLYRTSELSNCNGQA